MMKPIHMRIRKKTKTPTKNNLIHKYRYDWKTVGVINYSQTPSLFKSIGGGPIETDAQFAKWLKENYGVGVYSVLAWRKGREGFWGFIKVECRMETFTRLRKNKSSEKKEREKIVTEYNEMKQQMGILDDEDERKEMIEKMESMEGDLNVINELIDLDRTIKYGPGYYLKTIKPIFSEHLYDSLGVKESNEEVFNSLW